MAKKAKRKLTRKQKLAGFGGKRAQSAAKASRKSSRIKAKSRSGSKSKSTKRKKKSSASKNDLLKAIGITLGVAVLATLVFLNRDKILSWLKGMGYTYNTKTKTLESLGGPVTSLVNGTLAPAEAKAQQQVFGPATVKPPEPVQLTQTSKTILQEAAGQFGLAASNQTIATNLLTNPVIRTNLGLAAIPGLTDSQIGAMVAADAAYVAPTTDVQLADWGAIDIPPGG